MDRTSPSPASTSESRPAGAGLGRDSATGTGRSLGSTLQPLMLCLVLGVVLVAIQVVRIDSGIADWTRRSSSLLSQVLSGLARSGFAAVHTAVEQKVIQLEGWAGLSIMPDNVTAGDLDQVIAESLGDLKRGMGFDEVHCYDRRGRCIASTDLSRPTSAAGTTAGLPAGTRLSGPEARDGRSILTIDAVIRRRLAAGAPASDSAVGFLRATVDWERLTRAAFDSVQTSSTQADVKPRFLVVSHGGAILASSEPTPWRSLADAGCEALLTHPGGSARSGEYIVEAAFGWGKESLKEVLDRAGWQHLAALQPEPPAWGFVVLQPSRIAMAGIHQLGSRDRMVSVSITAGTILVLFLLMIWRFVTPTLRVAAFAERVGEGRSEERLDEAGSPEFKVLARSLNRMLDTIQRDAAALEAQAVREAQLRQERETEQRALESAVNEHLTAIGKMEAGDFTVRFREDGPRVTSILGTRLNEMARRTAALLGRMSSVVSQMSAVTAEVSATITQQVANFQAEGEALRTTSHGVEQLHRSAKESTTEADRVAEKSSDCARVFKEGEGTRLEVLSAMDELAARAKESAERMHGLAKELDRVDAILATVSEIAEQSKLLSLNAAIEAARAGETGRGFSVVAVEVRNMAVQSREASTEIKTIVRGIRAAAEGVTLALRAGGDGALRGKTLVERLATYQDELKAVLDEAQRLAARVRDTSVSQSGELDGINSAMRDCVGRMEQNLQGAREIEETAHSIDSLAEALRDATRAFQASESEAGSSRPDLDAPPRRAGHRPGDPVSS